jgi:hypothetical protein
MDRMLKDSEVAQLAHNIYSGGAGFDAYYPEEGLGICAAFKLYPDENLIVTRGTDPKLFENWLMDLMAYPALFKHPIFGPVNTGAFVGLTDMMAGIVPLLNPKVPTTIGGHSEAGSRAVLAAAIMKMWGTNPSMLRIVDVAGPNPGGRQLLNYVSDIKSVLYRNARSVEGDLVPFWPQPVSTYLVANLPKTHVTAVPGGWITDADPIAWHSSALAPQGIAALEAANAPA